MTGGCSVCDIALSDGMHMGTSFTFSRFSRAGFFAKAPIDSKMLWIRTGPNSTRTAAMMLASCAGRCSSDEKGGERGGGVVICTTLPTARTSLDLLVACRDRRFCRGWEFGQSQC